jgi:DNA-directed RNA polymerase specialized sigma24 family protein
MRSNQAVQREFGTAFAHLFTVACDVITRFYRYDKSAVEGAVSETMARTFENWEKVRARENPAEWVVGCAKDVCLERLRVTATHEQAAATYASTSVLPRQTMISIELWKTLEALPRRQREVATLLFLMDCDEAMAARALETTWSDVRSAARETRARLRVRIRTVYPTVDEAL